MYFIYKQVKKSRQRRAEERREQEQAVLDHPAEHTTSPEPHDDDAQNEDRGVPSGSIDEAQKAPIEPEHGPEHEPATPQVAPGTTSATTSKADSDVNAQPKNGKAKDAPKVLTPEEKAEKKRRMIYRLKLVLGLWGPFALQALDTTIIASALTTIADEFHQLQQLNWIISSFNLTSAAFLPFWAQMTDIFGRYAIIQAATFIMMIGSAISTGAPTSAFGVLLLGRAIQGVGAAGINISVRTILADRVSLSEFAVNWTIFVLINSISFSIGPLVGGYLVQASWRWCFAINLPVALLALVLVFVLLRKELIGPQPLPELNESHESSHRGRLMARLGTLDYGGQLLFLWGLGLLLLALTWAGSMYSWTSAAVLAPLIIGGVLAIAWVFYERAMSQDRILSRVCSRQRAMMPWDLLSQRDNCLVFMINFTGGMAMFAVLYFANLYFTLVEGRSASEAGVALLYYMPGLAAGAYLAVFSSKVWPRQTLPAIVFGTVLTAVGMTVLAWAVNQKNSTVMYGMMAIIGLGVAIRFNPTSLHCLAYFPNQTARITCLSAFATPFGGLVGLTIMSTVFNNKSGDNHSDPKTGIYYAYISMIPFMWVGVLLSLCLGNVWLLRLGEHDVLRGSYLWQLITRQQLHKERLNRNTDAWRAQVPKPEPEQQKPNV